VTSDTSDPSWHRARQHEFVSHVERLLEDGRFMVDTTAGRKAPVNLIRQPARGDKGVELKRQMSELGRQDLALQSRMPANDFFDCVLMRNRWFIFQQVIGHVKVITTAPTKSLLTGEAPQKLTSADVRRILADTPPPLGKVPMTVMIVGTAGFEMEARELAERSANRVVLLAEPNAAGGWSVHGPAEMKSTLDLLNPETEDAKRRRVRDGIDKHRVELLTGGLSADRVAQETQLPLQFVETELKSYARENPGLSAKRLEGRVMLLGDGSFTQQPTAENDMAIIDRIKSLFSRKGETEKKVALLNERRAVLSNQRDRAYDEIASLEKKETELREQFKTNESQIIRKRITGQLLQLRKEIERRQQMLQVLNQQINVVSTHVHNLELVRQGTETQMPSSEEIAGDAAKAEEVLAQLQADSELADSVGSSGAMAGMSNEEQALFDELMADVKPKETAKAETAGAASAGTKTTAPAERTGGESVPPIPEQRQRERTPAEPG
jgi:hypothetical protein